MWYAIITEDHENSLDKRMAVRPDHVLRLEALRDAGRLLIAGPHPAIDSPEPGVAGFTGSLIVAEFDSLEEAETWAQADPYVASGVIRSATVKPFNKVLP